MAPLSLFAPAKINLFLAITGRRPDGFHDLISLVVPLQWGDTLILEPRAGAGADTLACDYPGVPVDASNLVLKAAAAFRQRAARAEIPPMHFLLRKAVPAGAGLGGGSSDAAAALLGMNQLAAHPLRPAELRACAAGVGSDVALFIEQAPLVMRGRGEQIELLPAAARAVLANRELLVFKPPFGIATAWAYARLRERGADWYVPADAAEKQLAAWLAAPRWATLPLENNLEFPAFEKYAALPVLLRELRDRFNLRCRMSGSGSACFALLEAGSPREKIAQAIREAWGPEAVIQLTRTA
ncbi:MAG TPA: 4-(cytidine 5'-diphospho)-2-C-methyl-D-erythritol kinase [Opitutales bacterium]|nr:4-(cytidine 5'-diphospho)-2-C-methyl-D-erythritol kinase [Opitutales bacterium]